MTMKINMILIGETEIKHTLGGQLLRHHGRPVGTTTDEKRHVSSAPTILVAPVVYVYAVKRDRCVSFAQYVCMYVYG